MPPVVSNASDLFDYENRLVDRDGGTIQFLYDGDGHRVAKFVYQPTLGVYAATYYLIDDLNPTGYSQVLEELQPDPLTQELTVTAVNTWGLDLISQLRLREGQWIRRYYGFDGQGSVSVLYDDAGSPTDTYTYDAYGNLLARQVARPGGALEPYSPASAIYAAPNNYLYRGEEYDWDLGLYHLRARYYNPHTGRFHTSDTFDGFAGAPQSHNHSIYAEGNPVVNQDPSGYFAVNCLAGAMYALHINDQMRERVGSIGNVRIGKGTFEADIQAMAAAASGVTLDGFERQAPPPTREMWISRSEVGVVGGIRDSAINRFKSSGTGQGYFPGKWGDEVFFRLNKTERVQGWVESAIERTQSLADQLRHQISNRTWVPGIHEVWAEIIHIHGFQRALLLAGERVEPVIMKVTATPRVGGQVQTIGSENLAPVAFALKDLNPSLNQSDGGGLVHTRRLGNYPINDFTPLNMFDGPFVHFVQRTMKTVFKGLAIVAGEFMKTFGPYLPPEVPGLPGMAEGMIPVWGSGKSAVAYALSGHLVWGAIFAVITVAEAIPAVNMVVGSAKMGVRGAQLASRAGKAARGIQRISRGVGRLAGKLGRGMSDEAGHVAAATRNQIDDVLKRFNRKSSKLADDFAEAAQPPVCYLARLVRCFAAGTMVATATCAQPIETLRVGDRVASVPEDISAWQAPPVVESGVQPLDPEEWRLYTYAVQTDDIGRVDVCLLQPATLTRNGLDVGQTLEVRFDENGLAGPATVLAIEPCPPDLTLADGTILATFHRYVSGPAVELTVCEPNGTLETLTVTAEHPFATVERGWVASGSLSPGEHLHTRAGTETIVQSVHWKNENLPVFNLAIAHDHTYFAGQSSLLVHNAGSGSVTCSGGGKGADALVEVFRVDDSGFPRRIIIGNDGIVEVPVVLTSVGYERSLFLNFGDLDRAVEFAARTDRYKGKPVINSFLVRQSFLDNIRARSITEKQANQLNDLISPVKVDLKFKDQFGLRSNKDIQSFRESIIQGSGRIISF